MSDPEFFFSGRKWTFSSPATGKAVLKHNPADADVKDDDDDDDNNDDDDDDDDGNSNNGNGSDDNDDNDDNNNDDDSYTDNGNYNPNITLTTMISTATAKSI